ncbi:hypothetical protein [Sinorhizobium psoraleae]|uniref:Transposase n=1 Tax=Sinorhizobium psoraleae TaxID=520838 RepID=A0ABT4KQ71_9HYPH|nr:hypothetical protein [Sinorhizobium psoraleae]MCZ4093057.1 hypothetical protein [Sinorhizobium psoraleae]
MAEIMAEEFDTDTLLDMSQMEPTDARSVSRVKLLEEQAKSITAELEEAQTDPEMRACRKQTRRKRRQTRSTAAGSAGSWRRSLPQEQPTVEKVTVPHDNRLRPFVLDIETGSDPFSRDEQAEKEARMEFVQASRCHLAVNSCRMCRLLQAGPAYRRLSSSLRFSAPFRP